jgi:hypothetical protein
MILDQIDTSKHSLVSEIFCRAILGCQIWICMKSDSKGGIFIWEFLHVEEQSSTIFCCKFHIDESLFNAEQG